MGEVVQSVAIIMIIAIAFYIFMNDPPGGGFGGRAA